VFKVTLGTVTRSVGLQHHNVRGPGTRHKTGGTPVPSYVAGFAPDARPLDRGKPRDEDTEGGNQPADKSLINRRLLLHSQPCAAKPPFADGCLAPAGAQPRFLA
jgi:hypothetical protein